MRPNKQKLRTTCYKEGDIEPIWIINTDICLFCGEPRWRCQCYDTKQVVKIEEE